MDRVCVSGGVGCMFIVRTVVVCRGLLLLPTLSGRGPAQSAEREWPKRGSKSKGRSFSASKRGRSQWLTSEDLLEWFSWGEQSVFEACSGFEARRKGKGDSAEKETEDGVEKSGFEAGRQERKRQSLWRSLLTSRLDDVLESHGPSLRSPAPRFGLVW